MADTPRAATDDVEFFQALEREPYRFGFFQALRRLECAYRDKSRLGETARPAGDPVRLGQEPSLTFAPSTLASFSTGGEGRPSRLEILFLGLFGPNGPLPLHLTEYARSRLRNYDDPTFARFADLFHHRLLSLFYRAWANAQPVVQFDRPESDRFALYVGALCGLGMPSVRGR
ncbi:MAG: type VI secretion system baseplate subunit TssG, partial [Proteobacteria bacterium]|nr:type VI secretion system baseplate subunit TssG [Pseudomonadota bacterium]